MLVVRLTGQTMFTQLLQQAVPVISVRRPLRELVLLVTWKVSVFQPGTNPDVMLTGYQFWKAMFGGRKLGVAAEHSFPKLVSGEHHVRVCARLEHAHLPRHEQHHLPERTAHGNHRHGLLQQLREHRLPRQPDDQHLHDECGR